MSLPPAQPSYVLRGHTAQIHAVAFIRANTRLVTGDAEGWLVVWSLATKRATAVWKAHEGSIVGIAEWGPERLIIHGKDYKINVWQYLEQDETLMSTVLPAEDPTTARKQPWLLHTLSVNTLNFCSFALCRAQGPFQDVPSSDLMAPGDIGELLIAVPNALTSDAVDIFHLPSERRIHTVPGDKSSNLGMVMAVAIFYQSGHLTVVSGYESGHTMVSHEIDGRGWQILYISQPHTQPVLSLDLAPDQSFYLTSSADAIIAKHPIPSPTPSPTAQASSNLTTSKEDIRPPAPKLAGSGLSQLLAEESTTKRPPKATPSKPAKIEKQTTPLKIFQTKHSGQQSLKIRSDSKIFATAGWDARVRVYSVQSLKELAVLKWHKEGCYALSFAEIIEDSPTDVSKGSDMNKDSDAVGKELVTRTGTLSVKEKRILKATSAHWLAAGSKDGKVSLWEIY